MKKRLERITSESNTLKNKLAKEEKNAREIKEQYQSSLQERIALEKSLLDISTKVFFFSTPFCTIFISLFY